MNSITQIRIETHERYRLYLKDFFEEPLTFEEYLNVVLGQLFDQGHRVLDVKLNHDCTQCIIVYQMNV